MADLERAADAAVALESRAETAEGERDAALEQARPMIESQCYLCIIDGARSQRQEHRLYLPKTSKYCTVKQHSMMVLCVCVLEQMRAMTPRPSLPRGMHLPALLGPAGTAKFVAAVTRHRCPLFDLLLKCIAMPRPDQNKALLLLVPILIGALPGTAPVTVLMNAALSVAQTGAGLWRSWRACWWACACPDMGSLMASQPSALGCLARPLFKQKLAYTDLIKVAHKLYIQLLEFCG